MTGTHVLNFENNELANYGQKGNQRDQNGQSDHDRQDKRNQTLETLVVGKNRPFLLRRFPPIRDLHYRLKLS